jgi:hypothetical protein
MKNIKGKRIYQACLTPDQTNLISGQSQFLKGLLLVFIFVLFVLSGCLLGILGEQIVVNLIVPYKGSSVIFTCVGLSILSWLYFISSHGFVRGIPKTVITIAVIMALLTLTSNLNLGFALLFTPLYLSFAILSIFTSCLSLYLVDACFRHNKLIFISLYILSIVIISTMTAHVIHSFGELDHTQVN